MWREGIVTVNEIEIWYSCKHFDEPSEYGIDKGRISKLLLKQNNVVVYQFEKEIVTEPKTEEAMKALDYLINKYN